MIGVLCFVLGSVVFGVLPFVVLYALDARDARRRAERLARWYAEHGGGHVVDD